MLLYNINGFLILILSPFPSFYQYAINYIWHFNLQPYQLQLFENLYAAQKETKG